MKSPPAIITTAWLGLGLFISCILADPTWPATTDELEDYMFVTQGYGASAFAAHVIPCTASDFGPGRQVSAEWIRVGFHDMATTNIYYATVGVPHGGIDASLMFELNSGENVGAGFASSLTTYGEFFSKRTSVADLIALGVSTATRSCGGPLVPVKPGRIDATAAGPLGVPQPQNSLFTFQSQFQRMGFTTSEMILMTACGHTIGGVHAGNFPTIVIPGTVANDYALFDDTTDKFDEHIATQYLSGTTVDPLAVGPCVGSTRCSDKVTFNGDGNATISTIKTPTTFATNCQSIFQRMIETVPPEVTLGAALTPYTVKPYSLQLTLLSGGTSIKFEGKIRVRTTSGAVASVQLIYLDRSGGTGGTITTSVAGTASGFDDTFTFYGFSSTLDAATSISSFKIQVTYTTGGVTTYDNNGSGYPVQDSVIYLAPQSCLVQSGSMTVVAAVRNTISTAPTLDLSLKTARSGVPVPALLTSSLAMTKGSTIGSYTLYSVSASLTSDQLSNTQFDVSAGTVKDQFKASNGMGAVCSPLGTSASTSTSSTTSRSSTSSTSRTSTTSPTQTAPAHKPTIGAYTLQGCYTEGNGVRALSGASLIDYTSMTLEKCASNCAAYTYWGVEYSGECYCGNSLGSGSVLAPLADCSFLCPGNNLEFCGAGNRLELYGKGNFCDFDFHFTHFVNTRYIHETKHDNITPIKHEYHSIRETNVHDPKPATSRWLL
ncbi:WSC domain-containing protein-like protein 5 [Phlyctema vagabunda]|uniref:WSC domain-containing protein-like protein 5 n=1 Tax=Phlyctema vagabunda TaxID=108571 RepID=A0ABR4P8D3_9HELO